jgi:hypothetical protein
VNDGRAFFADRTIAAGLAAPSFPFTTFGTGWIDYDNDGWLDMIMMNGAVLIDEALAAAGDRYPLDEPNQLFRNVGGKRFVEVTSLGGPAFKAAEVSRGAAFGDVDNDGDTDVLIANNNGPARLLRNDVGQDRRWLGLRLIDGEQGRDTLGARAALRLKGGATLWRRVSTDGSYCSAGDPRVIFGLGEADDVESVEVFWPDGSKETWNDPLPMKYTTLTKGSTAGEKAP